MIINEKVLKAYGAKLLTLKKNEYLFSVDDISESYFQVNSGNLKITSNKNEKYEFIHNFINPGDPVGETFLFSNDRYNINAIALSHCIIYVLDRTQFNHLLKSHPEVVIKLYQNACDIVNYKMVLMNKIAHGDPGEKIIAVMDHLKYLQKLPKTSKYKVPYTRQQLASLSGLRIETVIRAVKVMEYENLVEIINGKIFY